MASADMSLPLFIEPGQVETLLADDGIVIVDLCKPEVHSQLHVPGARPLDYGMLLGGVKPAIGLLPTRDRLNQLCATLGIHPDSRVVAYDDEGGGRACRLAWNLHVMGFHRVSVIDGGIHAWANEGHPVTAEPTPAHSPGSFSIAEIEGSALAVRDYVAARVADGASTLFDSRSAEEYTGQKAFAQRGGHIPGAINLNWLDTMDRNRNLRLKTRDSLESQLDALGFHPGDEIITYCQTHHRSSHSYLMLKHLGFERVRGYAGAWAEWGNDSSLPVATGPEPGGTHTISPTD
ncbi:MAG: sulfurtransferase [Proteobacteria bacterium]|nr:MAG: sulfurtransferase [Pseudomonadota bacterium]